MKIEKPCIKEEVKEENKEEHKEEAKLMEPEPMVINSKKAAEAAKENS